MTAYQLTITMDASTVSFLAKGGYFLYGLKAVRASETMGAFPLVWFQTQAFRTTMHLEWQDGFAAYTSRQTTVGPGPVETTTSFPVTMGQQLTVTDTAGGGSVQSGSLPLAIEILNTSGADMSCGIAQPLNGGASAPICVFDLAGLDMDVIRPVEQVVLLFSTRELAAGSVLTQAHSQAMMVNLTTAPQRTIAYDTATGWGWGGASWGATIERSTDLVPLLIQSSPLLQQRKEGMLREMVR